MKSDNAETEKMKRQMYHAGWRHKPSPNFGDIYESRDDIHSVEITRAGEWMLYQYSHETNTAIQIDYGESGDKLFLAIIASGASFQGAR